MHDPIADKLTSARIRLLLEHPLYAQVILLLQPLVVAWCPTAATDGKHFYYNPEFIDKLTRDELVFLCGHEVLHCFPAGTLIAGDFKTIEHIEENDRVIAQNGEQTTVVAPMRHEYSGELVTIKARGLLPIELTPEHPILVRRYKWKTIRNEDNQKRNIRDWSAPEWKLAGDVQEGDWVHIPRLVGDITDHVLYFDYGNPWSVSEQMRQGVSLDAEIAEFLGWYVAEGSTTKAMQRTGKTSFVSCISLNVGEQNIAERLAAILRVRFGLWSKIKTFGKTCRLLFGSNPLGRWLLANCGHRAHQKRIPYQVLHNRVSTILVSFLRAYTEGDGNIDRAVHFGTVSKTLAMQMQIAWARFGILFNLYKRPSYTGVIQGRVVACSELYHGYTSWKDAHTIMGQETKTVRSTRYAGVIDDAVLTPIIEITRKEYVGRVYNMETSSHTYTAGNIVTHNCVFEHMGRRGKRNKDLWNMAADASVNYALIHSKVGKPIENCIYDPRFTDEYTVEEIYDTLDKEAVQIMLPLDMHLDGEGDDASDDEQGGDITEGPPTYTEAEQQAIADGIRAALLEGVKQQEAKAPGSTPAGILRMVEQLLWPRINWREMLDNVLRSSIKYDYTYTRISRRSYTNDLILPGSDVMDRVEAVACLDGSASTTQEMITDFLTECRGIMQTFRDFKLTVMTFDTRVYNVQEFTPDNADDIDSYDFHGGGGTAPSCCWRYMREHDIMPHKLLVFTDGYVGIDWGDPDFCDTLFIIHSNYRAKAPYGQTTHYEPRTSG